MNGHNGGVAPLPQGFLLRERDYLTIRARRRRASPVGRRSVLGSRRRGVLHRRTPSPRQGPRHTEHQPRPPSLSNTPSFNTPHLKTSTTFHPRPNLILASSRSLFAHDTEKGACVHLAKASSPAGARGPLPPNAHARSVCLGACARCPCFAAGVQASSGELRRAQASSGELRRAQASSGELRRTTRGC